MNRSRYIKHRLYGLAILSSLLITGLSAILLLKLNEAQQVATSLTEDRLIALNQITLVRDAFKDTRLHLNLAQSHDPSSPYAQLHSDHDIERHTKAIAADIAVIRKEWKAFISTQLVSEELTLITKITPMLDRALTVGIESGLSALNRGDFYEAGRLNLNASLPEYNQLDQLLPELANIQVAVSRDIYQDAQAVYEHSLPVIIGITLLGLLFIWIITDVVLVSLLASIRNQEESERKLQESMGQMQAIVDNAVDGIITIDGKGIVSSYNKAAESIFGYFAEQVIGQNIKMLMPEPYRAEHDGYLHNYAVTSVPRIIGIGREVTGLRQDGTTFPMDLAVSKVSRNDEPLFVGIVRDISERKRIEQMKSEFVSTVSHELRTPLTAISGVLGLLVGGALGALPVAAKPMVEIAHNNSLRLNHLINDLLDMEKIAAGKMTFDMQSHPLMILIEQALTGNQAYADKYQVTFALTQSADVQVMVDSQRLLQVMANFLSNAAKFSPQGKQVDISVTEEKNKVRVAVRDYGSGIPDEFRSRIFQKFAQADSSDTRQKGGTGLGLAITKELIERMGGKVGFDSVLGEGSTFFFELPTHAADNKAQPLKMMLNIDNPSILIIEDESNIASILALMLQRGGYQTEIALTGTQAMEKLRTNHYDAVTLDLMLPDMSGLEIIRRIRNDDKLKDLPVIVVSAKMEEGKIALNGDFSGIDWLSKPTSAQRLIDALNTSGLSVNTEKMHILHVEDDADLHRIISTMAGDTFHFSHAATLAQAKQLLDQAQYDVVILDIGLPDGSGWELIPLIKAHHPEPRIVILSGAELTHEESQRVEVAILKTKSSPQELINALKNRIQVQKKTESITNE